MKKMSREQKRQQKREEKRMKRTLNSAKEVGGKVYFGSSAFISHENTSDAGDVSPEEDHESSVVYSPAESDPIIAGSGDLMEEPDAGSPQIHSFSDHSSSDGEENDFFFQHARDFEGEYRHLLTEAFDKDGFPPALHKDGNSSVHLGVWALPGFKEHHKRRSHGSRRSASLDFTRRFHSFSHDRCCTCSSRHKGCQWAGD